jgi:hypothetical protein
VQLNELVAESIPILGGDLAALSDAAVAMLQLNDSVLTLTEGSYPDLLDAVDISSIQKLWKGRFESFLRDVHFLALLLDPRAHIRAFVQQQPSILGSNDMPVANRGNTQAINATIDALHRWADQCVSDDQPYVKKQVECGHMMLLDAKQKLLEGQLRAFLGLHPKLSIKVLGIGEDSFRKCVAGGSTLQWLQTGCL